MSMSLKRLSAKTGIPYTTLREWDKKRKQKKNDWRVKLLDLIQEEKKIEEKAVEKALSMFTDAEIESLKRAIRASEDEGCGEGKDWKKSLERKIDSYFLYGGKEDLGMRRAIKEKIKDLCDFELFSLCRFLSSRDGENY